MKRNIKMIGFDMDDTLLTSDKKITDHTKDVLIRAMAQGIVVLPATGRPVNGLPEDLLHLPGMRYAVTANGARILDIKENKLLHKDLLSADIVFDILDRMKKYDVLQEVNFDGISYTEQRFLNNIRHYFGDSPMKNYYLKTRKPVPDIRAFLKEAGQVDKLQFVFADLDERSRALEELADEPRITLTTALVNNMEINAKDVNKGAALIRLGQLLNIKREEIMAFGDGLNDIMMLKEVGFGIAMDNASDMVKEAADHITLSNNEDGVARAIEEFVL